MIHVGHTAMAVIGVLRVVAVGFVGYYGLDLYMTLEEEKTKRED